MKYGDALEQIVSELDAGGIIATADASKIQLPGALVVPGMVTFNRLDPDTYEATVDVYLLTADRGSLESLNDLQDLLQTFRQIFDVLEAEPLSLQVPNYPNPLPGLVISLNLEITKD